LVKKKPRVVVVSCPAMVSTIEPYCR